MSQKEQDLWRAVKGIIRIGGTVAFASLFPSRPDVDYMSVDVVGPSLGLQTGPRYALIATALAPDFMTEKATDGEAAEQEALLNADSGDPQQDSGPPEEIQDDEEVDIMDEQRDYDEEKLKKELEVITAVQKVLNRFYAIGVHIVRLHSVRAKELVRKQMAGGSSRRPALD